MNETDSCPSANDLGEPGLSASAASKIRSRASIDVGDKVEAAGGPTIVAERLGISRQAVYGWINRGNIPEMHRSALSEMIKR